MTSYADPYADLGLAPDASDADVRRAFRRLALKLHPDRNTDPEATAAFVRVRKAYEALTDPTLPVGAAPIAAAAFVDPLEPEEIVHSMARAAAEAGRRRVHSEFVARPISVRFPSPPAPFGFTRLEAERAGRVALRLALLTVLLLLAAVVTALPLVALPGALSLLAALGAWLTRAVPTELRLYADGFTDSRWEAAGRIAWADVLALDPIPASGLLDLQLDAAAAERLHARPGRPRDVLVWDGPRVFYRLALGPQFARATELVELRTGLSAR